MTSMLYILLAILLLGILIAFHEFGHFITARITGIPVVEFAVGMGPKILSRTGKKSGIIYSLRAIPVGGFCRFVGEDDPEGKYRDDSRCWSKQPLWKRFLTVLMGPGANFVLAFLALLLFFWIGGLDTVAPGSSYVPVLSSVSEGGGAFRAGLRAGDRILSVNGADTEISAEAAQDPDLSLEKTVMSSAINAWKYGDPPLEMVIERNGETFSASVTPLYVADGNGFMIGVTYTHNATQIRHDSLTFGQSVSMAWKEFTYYGTAIFDAVIGLLRGQNLEQVSGPVGTVQIISQEVQTYGFTAFVNLLALISVNLGIMNLLPIPGLDGSRLIFMLIEAIRGKPVPPEKEAVVHLIGMALLFALMIFITVRDIGNLIR